MPGPRYCVNCAAMLKPGMRFCPDCGSPAEFGAAPPDAPMFPLAPRQSWTVTREYVDLAARDRDAASMGAHGWAIQNMTVTPGRYKAGKGCFLFLLFAPLALLAGNDPDRWTVIYGTTIPPERGHLPPPLMGGHQIA